LPKKKKGWFSSSKDKVKPTPTPTPTPTYTQAVDESDEMPISGGGGGGGEGMYAALDEMPIGKGAPMDAGATASNQKLVPCGVCNRKFAADRLASHAKICKKVTNKTRKVYNTAKMRVGGTEASEFQRGAKKAQKEADKVNTRKKKDWRAESKAFRDAMRAARGDP
jgi:hypothetical protein